MSEDDSDFFLRVTSDDSPTQIRNIMKAYRDDMEEKVSDKQIKFGDYLVKTHNTGVKLKLLSHEKELYLTRILLEYIEPYQEVENLSYRKCVTLLNKYTVQDYIDKLDEGILAVRKARTFLSPKSPKRSKGRKSPVRKKSRKLKKKSKKKRKGKTRRRKR